MSATAVPAALAAQARAWIDDDPDAATRSELEALLEAGDVTALQERFAEPLTFGTAGLRAPLGAGPARMNRLVVRRTTAGVARWLLGQGEPVAAAGLVVGRDARHGSATFAADVVEVAAALGVAVRFLPEPLPTPLTAFAVLHYGAAAGVMVTASHNPAPDNGYKVYAADGAQILPPDDALIAAGAEAGPLPQPGAAPAAPGLVIAVERDELLDAYATAVLPVLAPGGPRSLRVVYTPVHGVGGGVLPWLMARAGFAPPIPVPAQAEPDPDFPTAPFPNPEEPGVLDLALVRARLAEADLLIANDPDADRLAVAVPTEAGGDEWRVLTGDELGALLGDELIRRRAGTSRATGAERPVVASSIVSASLLGTIAETAGVTFVETLTGFKWIARAADGVPGGRLVFGYEEALGYAVSPAVRDKDGLSAALLACELVAAAKEDGRTLLDRLDELDARFGVHRSSQWSLRLEGGGSHQRLIAIVDRWRSEPPTSLGGLVVIEVVDLEQQRPGLPPTAGVLLRLRTSAETAGAGAGAGAAAGAASQQALAARVVVRPSGTEAKLKAYLEVVAPPTTSPPRTEASTADFRRATADSRRATADSRRATADSRREVAEAMEALRVAVAAALAP